MKFVVRYCLLLIFLFLGFSLFSQQKEANIWYFGRFLGLDFNSGTAVPLNDGKTNTIEGVATISDKNGSILFYTDGITIWNKLHQVMPNGTGLFGDASSTQSAIVVPWINDPTRYYVFTVAQLSGPRGLTYSVVNMNLAGGNGDVELKNVPLQSNVVEKITAVRHCNNRDVWVMAHGSASDIYYAFLVTGAGVNTTPVVSHTGTVLPGTVPSSIIDSSSLGYLKASPDGSRLAAAHFTVGTEVSDFNNGTGIVSNTVGLFLPSENYHLPYGVEFSPDSRLLYTTVFYKDPVNAQQRNVLLQYDMSLALASAIQGSKQIISLNSDPIQTYAALQIAPDGKMYMAKNTYAHIAAINNPNVIGAGCNFVSNAIQYSLPNQASSFGLPTFIQTYFYPPDSFRYSSSCPGASFQFNYNITPTTNSVKWNFNDPASGANNISTLTNPAHQFSAPGNYTVELIKFTNCGSDTLRRLIKADTLNIYIGADTSVCASNLLLNGSAIGSANTFLWQDGSTQPTYNATSSGLYWVEVANGIGCKKRDSINVTFGTPPAFNLGPDLATVCDRDTLILSAAASNATSYQWNNGDTTPSIKVAQAGLYWCEAVKNGCKYRDSLSITSTRPSPVVDLGNDIRVCEGILSTLDATYLNSTYLWQDGSTQPTFNTNQPGKYYVQVDYFGCKSSDTIIINHTPKPVFTLGPDQYICPANNILLQPAIDPSWQLMWQDGSTGSSYTVTHPGDYSLTATNNCGSSNDAIAIGNGVCKVYVPNAFTPNNDGLNDVFKAYGTEGITKMNMKIFNRWGQVLFETNDKSKGWDGRFNGTPLDAGAFIYMLNYTDINSQSQSLKGTLVLIR